MSSLKNWIITDKGDLVNLDFLSKILWGGYFSGTAKPNNVYLYHGITAGKSSALCYTYSTADLALAAYRKYLQLLLNNGNAVDMRTSGSDSITNITPSTFSVSSSASVVIDGSSLNPFAVLTSDGGAFSAINIQPDGTLVATFTAGTLSGTFNFRYESAGIITDLPGLLNITP